MLSKKMEKALNDQINAEFFSAFLYLSMSAYFTRKNLPGFANWLKIQYQEESAHAMLFFNYLNERGGKAELKAIEKPDLEWKDSIKVFEEVLKHEQKVTALINNLVNIAIQEKDHATNNKLQWFVAEQVEEEANASEILEQLKIVEGKGQGLLLLDRELKTRVFVDPTIQAQ
ncbi:MAG TPA: ferritin [Bacteroidales bacterium]|nr:ferritin [Bacteroidales bacterium]HPS27947.1 ferritin [Bacteroidales bacterium]